MSQLESARRFAVAFEQDAAELQRRISVALAYLADLPCEGGWQVSASGFVASCPKHQLEGILRERHA